MERDPNGQGSGWEATKTVAAMGGAAVLLVGGGAAAAEFFSRGTPEGTLGGMIMTIVALSGLAGILEGRRQL